MTTEPNFEREGNRIAQEQHAAQLAANEMAARSRLGEHLMSAIKRNATLGGTSMENDMDGVVNRLVDSFRLAVNPHAGTAATLSRDWHNIVGHDSAATSRPVAIVEDVLVVEVTKDSKFSAREMSRALDALGRDDVDRVAVRVVDKLQDQTQKQTPSKGMRR